MSEDGNKLLENLMGMLGDNPSETLGQMLSALSSNNAEQEEKQTDEHTNNAQTPLDTAGGFDPAMLLKMQSLIGQLHQDDSDDRSALLQAIRPFLSEEKRPQVDQAIKLLKLTKLAKTAQDMDLFKGLL